MDKQPFIVCITGGTASGKSSFARDIKLSFLDDEMTVISQDHYYRLKTQVPIDDNGMHNFDIPEAMDDFFYIEHIRKLKAGISVERQEYTFNRPGIIPKLLTFNPTPLIVIEGIFSLHFEKVNSLFDLKIFIDANNTIRLNRRIKRDVEERDVPHDDVIYRWENHINPTFEKHCIAYKDNSDIIVSNNTNYTLGLNVVTAFLKEVLKSKSS